MPQKKSQKNMEKVEQKKGKKGGKSQVHKIQHNGNKGVDYVEIDEFTLDDITDENKV